MFRIFPQDHLFIHYRIIVRGLLIISMFDSIKPLPVGGWGRGTTSRGTANDMNPSGPTVMATGPMCANMGSYRPLWGWAIAGPWPYMHTQAWSLVSVVPAGGSLLQKRKASKLTCPTSETEPDFCVFVDSCS